MPSLTSTEARLLRENSDEGRAFRAGALCEARAREVVTVLHHELIDYVRTMAEHHPEWTSGRIARAAAAVFWEGE